MRVTIEALLLAAVACSFGSFAANHSAANLPPEGATCPVVYRLDESPSPRGYHYAFFGNAFFINEQGYLLTDAHVLETFRDGGQPYLIVRRPNAPPRLLQAAIVATDPQHDVAILRVTPNPFAGKYRVAALPLATDPAAPGQSVIALSLHPIRLQDAQSLEAPREDRSPGTVLSYESTQLEESAPATKVFLLSHSVDRGQSGSPVLASDSHVVVASSKAAGCVPALSPPPPPPSLTAKLPQSPEQPSPSSSPSPCYNAKASCITRSLPPRVTLRPHRVRHRHIAPSADPPRLSLGPAFWA